MTARTHPTMPMTAAERFGLLHPILGDAPIHLALAIVLLTLSIAGFLAAPALGIAMTFVMTLALTIALPASIPLIVIAAFVFQNTIIAAFTPLIVDNDAFDMARGVNFVVLVAAFGAYLFVSFIHPQRILPLVWPWLRGALAVLGVVMFYLVVGAVRGETMDAVIYFRNTLTPIACFYIALLAASWYRVDLNRGIVWIGAIAIAYAYCELFFTFDFLSLFNGDLYVQRGMEQQIKSGYWEHVLTETGFVLRNLDDVMKTTFFNTTLFGDIFPEVFRLAGPNFHAISFAYLLSLISVWQLFHRRWVLPLLAFPLLVVIGSKGAMILLLLSILVRIGIMVMTPQLVMALFVVANFAWLAVAIILGKGAGDYHVLGLMAGLRDFIADPLGQGLGIGGNLSSSVEGRLDWSWAQETGATAVPVESAVGVLLYQMGVGSFVLFGFLYALTRKCRQLYLATGNSSFLFGFVAIVGISTNAVLQEEAFYSPLALGLCLVFVAYTLGNHFKSTTSRIAALTAPPPVADGTPLDGSWAGSRPFGDRSGSFAAKTF